MPQRGQVSWSELRVGLFVLVGLGVLGVGIFYVTGAGVFGPKYNLKTYLPEVSGLAPGAPVRLDGVEIGNVGKIRIVPREKGKPPDRRHNVEVDMRIDRRYEDDILTDSTATLVTEGLLGNRYVNIERGYTGIPLKEGQAIPGGQEKAIQAVMEESSDVLANLKVVTGQVQGILGDVRAGKGTIGKLLTDERAYNRLNGVLVKTDQIVSNVQAGKGTVGKLLMTDELYSKVNTGVDSVNTILGDVRAQKGTIGKFLYDPTLYDQAKEAITNGNAIMGDIRNGKGTLGKLATDDVLYNKLRDTSTNVATATSKLNQNDNTAGKIFSDPALYDNLTSASADLRQFLVEFRKNPKKYLTLKLTFF